MSDFPVDAVIETENLDAGSDSPASARADLYDLAVAVAAIIASANQPNGIPLLTSAGLLRLDQLPSVPLTGDTVPISKGGTAATTAAEARVNLGVIGIGEGIPLETPFYLDAPTNTVYIKATATAVLIMDGSNVLLELPRP